MNQEPAFPTGIITDGKGKIIGGSNGMTLRDYFAAKAMYALLTDPEIAMGAFQIAELAYRYADAMMTARSAT